MIAFRTMLHGAEDRTEPVCAAWRDARVSRVGRFLRRLHLDELPQLVNIARGEMSPVGPRPERREMAARLERTIPGFAERLRVCPGIAGLAQARGPYRLHPRSKLRSDRVYMARMSPRPDLRLCVSCLGRALRGPSRLHRGARASAHAAAVTPGRYGARGESA